MPDEEKKNDMTDSNKNPDEDNSTSISNDIWDQISLPELPSASDLSAMYRSTKFQSVLARKRRFGNSKGTGATAEDRAALQISDCIGWVCTPEKTQGGRIDLFAISLQQPYKIALIQVKSAHEGSRTVHVDEKYLEFEIGPIWIIVDETDPKIDPQGFAFLIFSHQEFKEFVTEEGNSNYYGIEDGYENPEYDLNVPKYLEGTRFARFQNKWWKIEKNARLYIK